MGPAKHMVTVRFYDSLFYPTAYFFSDSVISVKFYNEMINRYNVEAEIQLWKLFTEPDIIWKLLRTN